jgi:hypothetical protein
MVLCQFGRGLCQFGKRRGARATWTARSRVPGSRLNKTRCYTLLEEEEEEEEKEEEKKGKWKRG